MEKAALEAAKLDAEKKVKELDEQVFTVIAILFEMVLLRRERFSWE